MISGRRVFTYGVQVVDDAHIGERRLTRPRKYVARGQVAGPSQLYFGIRLRARLKVRPRDNLALPYTDSYTSALRPWNARLYCTCSV